MFHYDDPTLFEIDAIVAMVLTEDPICFGKHSQLFGFRREWFVSEAAK